MDSQSFFSSSTVLRSQLSICIFARSEQIALPLKQSLSGDRYILVTPPDSETEFCEFIEHNKQQLDCLILHDTQALQSLINCLYERGTLLPVVIVLGESEDALDDRGASEEAIAANASTNGQQVKVEFFYHAAEVRLSVNDLNQIERLIDKAIEEFLKLSTTYRLPEALATVDRTTSLAAENSLMLKQRRLAEKLKERLGYLGVYYKRNPENFFRNLPRDEKQKLLEKLKSEYRQIILNYFSQDKILNEKIDEFVNDAFFLDLSVSRIVEIHMELMEDFSKQLKLEGRTDDVLLDYRLTLIDVIAHLCEMYRRSIPRES